MDDGHFEKVLALSTGHMPNTAPRFGDCRVRKFEYGYVVWATDVQTEEWLKPIMKSAIENDCTLILFDADCDICEQFPVYDW